MEPVFGGSYSESGMGKTADAVFAFPTAVFLAGPGSLKVAQSVCGVELPYVKRIETLEDAIDLLRKIKKNSKTRPFAYVLDDLSLIQQQSIRTSNMKNYELWRDVLDRVLDIAHIARYDLEAHFWITAHEKAPSEVRGKAVPGGPLLQGMASYHLPKEMDLLLRVQREEARPIWPFVYQCNNVDSDYITKDRTNTCANIVPMNTGEILRAAGYKMERPKGLEWIDDVAGKIAEHVVEKDLEIGSSSLIDFLRAVDEQIKKKYIKSGTPSKVADLHSGWALRDGLDRAVLKKTSNSPQRRLGL